MKEAHDDAKNRIFLAASAHDLVTTKRLQHHITESAEEAQRTRLTMEEQARFREKVAKMLETEKQERFSSHKAYPAAGWKMPQPMVWSTPVTTPAASSSAMQPPHCHTNGQVTLKDNSGHIHSSGDVTLTEAPFMTW